MFLEEMAFYKKTTSSGGVSHKIQTLRKPAFLAEDTTEGKKVLRQGSVFEKLSFLEVGEFLEADEF